MRRALVAGLLAGSALGLGACTSSPPGWARGLRGRTVRVRGRVRRGPRSRAGRAARQPARPPDGRRRLRRVVARPPRRLRPAGPRGRRRRRRTSWATVPARSGSKPCQVAAVALPSGETRAFAARLDPPGAAGGTAYCRHGGGAALTDAGLWVVETVPALAARPGPARLRPGATGVAARRGRPRLDAGGVPTDSWSSPATGRTVPGAPAGTTSRHCSAPASPPWSRTAPARGRSP